jgi:hypothetical protein
MFSSEWAITIELPAGERITAFVDKSLVKVRREPAPGQYVPGELEVLLVKERGDTLLLELLAPSLTSPSRIEAPRSLLVAPG